jgi:hypothetical protein
MKIRTYNTITKVMDLNPCLLYENGKFVLTMKQEHEYSYVPQQWLTNIVIMCEHWVNFDLTVFDGDIIKTKYKENDEYYYVQGGILTDIRCLDNDIFGDDFYDYYYNDGDSVEVLKTAEIIGNIYEYDFKALQDKLKESMLKG